VFDNLSTGYKINISHFDVELIHGDVRNRDLLTSAAHGMEVIFHLAAHIGNVKSLQNPVEDSSVNVLGTLNVLEAARIRDVPKVVYSSSAAIFGELLTMPIAEDHPKNPDSPYGVSKLAGELHALGYGKLYKISVVALRYFNVYGINQRFDAYGNVIPIFANQVVYGRPLIIYGDGEQTRDFVHVKDVAMVNFIAATRLKLNGVYNVGSGRNITINKLANDIQKAAGITIPIEYTAPRIGEVKHCRADITKLTNDFDYRPDSNIENNLIEYMAWFKSDFQEIKK
jgi:nucleoside-diphosphate-sugar epimerase